MNSPLPGEPGFPYTPNQPHPAYAAAVAAGEPVVDVDIPGLWRSRCVLLSTNLDGSRWLLAWHGGTVCVDGRHCTQPTRPGVRHSDPETSHRAWEAQNEVRISHGQLKVLLALRDAGDWGMTDHEHEAVNGLLQDSAGKRRLELKRRGLVDEKTGFKRPSPRGEKAQVWVITTAGLQALRADRPPSLTHLTVLAPAS